MSAKSAKKVKQSSTPRPLADIQAAYSQLCANAGQLEYQMRIQKRELDRIYSQVEQVNTEAAARMQLDREAADKATVAAATTTETPKQEAAV